MAQHEPLGDIVQTSRAPRRQVLCAALLSYLTGGAQLIVWASETAIHLDVSVTRTQHNPINPPINNPASNVEAPRFFMWTTAEVTWYLRPVLAPLSGW